MWAISSYFLYLYMVFIQHCFHLEQHCFHLDRQFSFSPKTSNWLSWVPTQSSQVIQNSCSSDYPVLYQCTFVYTWSISPLWCDVTGFIMIVLMKWLYNTNMHWISMLDMLLNRSVWYVWKLPVRFSSSIVMENSQFVHMLYFSSIFSTFLFCWLYSFIFWYSYPNVVTSEFGKNLRIASLVMAGNVAIFPFSMYFTSMLSICKQIAPCTKFVVSSNFPSDIRTFTLFSIA